MTFQSDIAREATGHFDFFVSSFKVALSVTTPPKHLLSGVLLFDFVFAPLHQNIRRVKMQINSRLIALTHFTKTYQNAP